MESWRYRKEEEMSRQRNSINNLVWGIIGNLITSIVAIVIPRLFIVNYGSEINGLLASIRQIYVYLALLEIGGRGCICSCIIWAYC